MKLNFFIMLIFSVPLTLSGMHQENEFSTYNDIPITPETILKIAPEMSADLEKIVIPWVEKNQTFLRAIVVSPIPYNGETVKEKTKINRKLINKNHNLISCFPCPNYVFKPKDNDQFVVKINHWGSRITHLIYATDQGSIFKRDFNFEEVDFEQFVGIPTYQHVSHIAHYLRLSEIIEKKNFQYLRTSPTHLVHIPGQPQQCCDENFIIIQKFVPGFIDLRALEKKDCKKYTTVIKNLPEKLIQELYEATKYAALWDVASNLGIAMDGKYYILDLEEPLNHKPQFFYFQGEAGYKKYFKDVRDALERVAKKLKKVSEKQFNVWKKITEEDQDFLRDCKKQNTVPYYVTRKNIASKKHIYSNNKVRYPCRCLKCGRTF